MSKHSKPNERNPAHNDNDAMAMARQRGLYLIRGSGGYSLFERGVLLLHDRSLPAIAEIIKRYRRIV
jgi:hypothetical protein